MTSNYKHHVIAFCDQMGLSLLKPSKADRTILVYDNAKPLSRIIAEGTKWQDISRQLSIWRAQPL